MKPDRDLDKIYPLPDFIAKLRRLADTLEAGGRFEIQIAGERIHVPARAICSIEHERDEGREEIEFQLRWEASPAAEPAPAPVLDSPAPPVAD
ncbi:MAG TPA: amphi-Trp domain-containing protein [Roseomonas sp.]